MTLHIYTPSRDRASDFKLLQSVAQIHFAAWMTIPLMQTIYHGPESSHPIIVQKYIDRHTNSLRSESSCWFVVVIDDALEEDIVYEAEQTTADSPRRPRGRVIAAIKYYIVPGNGPHPDTDTQDVIDNPQQAKRESWYENVALGNTFVEAMVGARKNAMRTFGPHLLIDNLYTDPSHHRRGAGGMLMRHACQHADDLGLPAMLEASPAGMKVYEAAGFRKIEGLGAEIWVDLKRWQDGGDKGQKFEDDRLKADPTRSDSWYAQVVMVRAARTREDSGQVSEDAGKEGAIVV